MFDGEPCQLSAIVDIGFSQDAIAVSAHDVATNIQISGDLLVFDASGDKPEHFDFVSRQQRM